MNTLILLILSAASTLWASGPAGIYAIVEKVAFEPNEQAPERIRVWGAFAFTDLTTQEVTEIRQGYVYFRLPVNNAAAALREWRDLKSVAGTGQVVAFGRWGYIGGLAGLQSNTRKTGFPPYFLAPEPGNPQTELRVWPENEAPREPAAYSINTGIVKLSADGNNSAIVRQLRDAVK